MPDVELTEGPLFASGHALVVAVANYSSVSPLPPAVLNDAQDIAAALVSPQHCGYDANNVALLLDGAALHEGGGAALDGAAVHAEGADPGEVEGDAVVAVVPLRDGLVDGDRAEGVPDAVSDCHRGNKVSWGGRVDQGRPGAGGAGTMSGVRRTVSTEISSTGGADSVRFIGTWRGGPGTGWLWDRRDPLAGWAVGGVSDA